MKYRIIVPIAISIFTYTSAIAPKKVQANPAIPAAVFGCAVNPACVIGVVVIGGVLYWEFIQNRQLIRVPVPQGIDPYRIEGEDPEILEDPEDVGTEWTESVLANNEADAYRRCQAISQSSGLNVRLVRVVRRSKNGKTWDCYLYSVR
ncbi:hypothetical protein PN441_03590 [Spirulina major CS-329]|uniref:hypothetical protein n=1 Tax=Spirulina TaxID=1154 RepID=UPI002331583F|nr:MULTISPECIES: hypothetical protein [Spirulina]MDB9496907.1 hypothetical protein [Spirulina subsalsa CS-330]MDB9502141.1 hypothetical protein [Spirulina major CS-329]